MVGRTVLGTPYTGVFGLLDWADDNWPYVNGKALTSGINLKELEASSMLDVIHFFFEEDLQVSSKEEAEASHKIRQQLYRTLYKREYRSAFTSSETKYNGTTASGESTMSTFSGPTESKKPYIPPTQFDPNSASPFGEKLDAPLK